MNQNDYTEEEHENLRKKRFLGDIDVESRLNFSIQKVETDLKESIQKVETGLKESIQKVETGLKEDIQIVRDNHSKLVSRLWWGIGLVFTSIVAIAVALITKWN